MKDIIVAGDIHGNWGPLNELINKKNPKLILQVGDFGWWPRAHGKPKRKIRDNYGRIIKPWDNYGVKPGKTEIYWCPGNHEDWDELSLRNAIPSELYKNIFYMRRGAILTLSDGRIVLFMGGGLSIDKESRTIGIDWFPQELIPYSEFYKLQETNIDKIDIVISHTCPLEFNPKLHSKQPYEGWQYKFMDCSQQVLSAILKEYKPSLWYFGHFHVDVKGQYDNTKWYCLNYPGNGGKWWRYLKDE